jgi:lantibiotic modifying enzyme
MISSIDYNIIIADLIRTAGKKEGNILFDKPGVLTGNQGITILYFYLSRVSNDPSYSKKGYSLLNRFIEHCNSIEKLDLRFGSGMAGLGWLIEHLSQQEFLTHPEDFLIDLDKVLKAELYKQLHLKNFDLFDGANGLMQYFLIRKEYPEFEKLVGLYIENLISASVQAEDLRKWYVTAKNNRNSIELTCNLGVPHGVLGTLSVLLKIEKRTQIHHESIIKLIKEVSKSILHERVSNEVYSFPSIVFLESKTMAPSDLAWCYGDLSAGYMLLQAGIVTNDESLKEASLSFLLEICKRTDCREGNLTLCHGLISVSHLFYKIFWLSKEMAFKQASVFWLHKTYTLINEKIKDGSLQDDKQDLINEYSLLYGYPGLALSLISQTTGHEVLWDECLLL